MTSTQHDEEALTELYAQRQEIIKQLAEVDTNIKLLESKVQDKAGAASKLVTDELTSGGTTEIDKVKQLIFRCMRDASGLKDALKVTDACRHFQETLSPDDDASRPRLHFRNVFVHEVIAHARDLAADSNGSDFLQYVVSVMKSGSVSATLHDLSYDVKASSGAAPSTASELILLVEQLGDRLVPIACNTSGARVTQKIIDGLTTVEEFEMLSGAISAASYVELAKDINGNHTLSRLISSNVLKGLAKQGDGVPALGERVARIHGLVYEPITKNCIDICKSRQGCCIIQRCLQWAPDTYYTPLIDTVLSNSLKLVQDPFGNYVIQFVLDRHEELGAARQALVTAGSTDESIGTRYTNQIIRHMLHHVAELSCNKFSSNVVEKCLKTASSDVRQLLVDELTDPQVLPKLLTDSFANYVMQTAIVTASDDDQFAQLRDSIMPLQNLLKNSPYGVKIEAKLTRRYRETTRKQTKKKEAVSRGVPIGGGGVPPGSGQENFMGLPPPPPPPPPRLPSMLPGMPAFVSQDAAASMHAQMGFANISQDLLFSQQQMLGSVPFMFPGNQNMLGLSNPQAQFMPAMNMNLHHAGMNIAGNPANAVTGNTF